MRRCFVCLMIIGLSILKTSSLCAQYKVVDYPVIGQPSPDFTLFNVHNFISKKVNLTDFRGKWLVLDFWTKTCSICISSFPKVNKMRQEFKDQIEFILVGNNGGKHNHGIEHMFNNIKQLQGLDLPFAFDSLLFERFAIRSTPHIVVIDPKGVVRAISGSAGLNSVDLKTLITSEYAALDEKDNTSLRDSVYKTDTPYSGLSVGNLNSTLINASALSKWDKSLPAWLVLDIDANGNNGFYRSTSMSLERLYNVAYVGKSGWRITDNLYGRFWRVPIFKFKPDKDLYNYELKTDKNLINKEDMMRMMKYDLKKYFGYTVEMKKRRMPYWKLAATKTAFEKLRTKGGVQSKRRDHSGFSYINVGLDDILLLINGYHPQVDPIINRTGLTNAIDMEVLVDMTNFKAIQEVFRENGLQFKRRKKIMNVIEVSTKGRFY